MIIKVSWTLLNVNWQCSMTVKESMTIDEVKKEAQKATGKYGQNIINLKVEILLS